MGCKKGATKRNPKKGRYKCTECGVVVKKKDDVCEPAKIKKGAAEIEFVQSKRISSASSPSLPAEIEKAPMPPRRARSHSPLRYSMGAR